MVTIFHPDAIQEVRERLELLEKIEGDRAVKSNKSVLFTKKSFQPSSPPTRISTYCLDNAHMITLYFLSKLAGLDKVSEVRWGFNEFEVVEGWYFPGQSQDKPIELPLLKYVQVVTNYALESFRSSAPQHETAVFLLQKLCIILGVVCKQGLLDPSILSQTKDILLYLTYIHISTDPHFSERLLQTLYRVIQHGEESCACFQYTLKPMPFYGRSREEYTLMRLAIVLGGRGIDHCLPCDVLAHIKLYGPCFTTPIHDSLVQEIESCGQLLMEYSDKECETSNEWFRKSVLKSDVAAIQQMGLVKWKQAHQGAIDPCLVASYMKMLCRQVPDGLVHKTLQDLMIHLLHGGSTRTDKKTVQIVQDLFAIDASRLAILSSLGQVAMLIFKKSKTKILPQNLAVVIPVDDEAMMACLPSAAEAKLKMQESMARFTQWNATFGLLLANADLFFLKAPY